MPYYTLNTSTTVAVIGAGSMGAGIAQLAAQSGHAVRLFDAQAGAADSGLKRIAADLDGAVKRGKLDGPSRDAVLARISVAASIDKLADCGLVVERSREDRQEFLERSEIPPFHCRFDHYGLLPEFQHHGQENTFLP